jgi:hypothetical protein
MIIEYLEPLFDSFPISSQPSDTYSSLFVGMVQGAAFQVYAKFNAISHEQVCMYYKARHARGNGEITCIGGGSILVDHRVRPKTVYGSSPYHKALPNKFLIDYFRSFGHEVDANMDHEGPFKGLSPETMSWFLANGIVL